MHSCENDAPVYKQWHVCMNINPCLDCSHSHHYRHCHCPHEHQQVITVVLAVILIVFAVIVVVSVCVLLGPSYALVLIEV